MDFDGRRPTVYGAQPRSSARLGRASGKRESITLACVDCQARNYKTTKAESASVVELKKFCKQCKRHTLHRETK